MNKYKDIIDVQNQIIVNKLKEIDVLEDKKSEYYFNWKKSKQLQNQKAIECLKEIKELLISESEWSDNGSWGGSWYLPEGKIEFFIDNKIKELEEDK